MEDMIRLFKERKYECYVTVELYSECYRDPELMLANSSRIIQQIRSDLNL